jgi:hypothetical protein
VSEGLSATEVGKEIGAHADEHTAVHGEQHKHHRALSIIEAVLLSIVTLTAAWSGYSAAKWGTHSTVQLARSTDARTKANRAFQAGLTLRAQDLSQFDAWFSAYLAGRPNEERVAERRFRPEYDVAFRAWLATRPFTNPHAPKEPSNMSQYKLKDTALADHLDAEAEALAASGEAAAGHGDDYIRVTVILASVLFLVGISSHFPLRSVRMGLIAVGAALLIVAAVAILQLPGPP